MIAATRNRSPTRVSNRREMFHGPSLSVYARGSRSAVLYSVVVDIPSSVPNMACARVSFSEPIQVNDLLQIQLRS
jgi:hypothetical protein